MPGKRRYRKSIYGKRTSQKRRAVEGLRLATDEAYEAAKTGVPLEEIRAKREREEKAGVIYQDILGLTRQIEQTDNPFESEVLTSVTTEKEIRFDELAQEAGQRENPNWPLLPTKEREG